MAMMCLTVETADQGWQETVVPDHIGELLTDRKNLLWLDICDPGPEELELLRHSFDFHELALEDVAKRHQRPKCDAYGQYDFIVIYAGEHTADTFVPHELQLFWAENYVVTIHQGALEVVDEARKRWQRHPNRQQDGLGYVIYVLFDSIMDSYFVLQDWVGERVEIVEEGIFLRPEEDVTADIFRLRKELLRIRRLLAPTGDVLHEVIRRSQSRFPARLVPYFADVQDHSLRVLDGLDTYRDLLAAALDVELASMSNRLNTTMVDLASASNGLNQIMKRLTALTLIILVPNFVASIYGMNFDKLFPPTDWEHGFWAIIGLQAVMIVWGFIHSRRLGWL